jgi:hypothetical protein
LSGIAAGTEPFSGSNAQLTTSDYVLSIHWASMDVLTAEVVCMTQPWFGYTTALSTIFLLYPSFVR